MANNETRFQEPKHGMADLRPTGTGKFMDGLQGQSGSSVDLPCRKNYLSGDDERSLASVSKIHSIDASNFSSTICL